MTESWQAVRSALPTFRLSVAFAVAVACTPPILPAQDDEPRDLIIRGLSFEGNHTLDDRTLRASIKTSQSSFAARFFLTRVFGLGEKRHLNETDFRRDVERLKALYKVSGFRDAVVDTVVRRTNGDAHIRFLISEGDPVRITSLTVSGADSIVPARDLIRELPLRVGDPFNRRLLLASTDTIAAILADLGYPWATVLRNFDQDHGRREANLQFVVNPGLRARVDSVEVVGTDRIDERVVRRMLSVRPGQVFRQRDLYESQLDLYRVGTFNYVNVALADTGFSAEEDSLVTVRVRVSEGPLHRLRLGAGYGTLDCFRALSRWSMGNFLGGGRTLSLSARVSKIGTGRPFNWDLEQRAVCDRLEFESEERLRINYNVTASLQQPFFLSRRTSATASLFAERHSEFQAYMRQAIGGEIALTRRVRRNLPVSLSYTLSHGFTEAEPASFCTFLAVCTIADIEKFKGEQRRAVVGLSVVHNRTDSPLDPTRGSVLTVELGLAAKFVLSDTLNQFLRGVVEHASYYRTGRRSVFAWRVQFGAVVPPELDFTGQEDRYVPPQDRFYAGGPNSVRGFSQNELGPVVRVLIDGAGSDTVRYVDSTGTELDATGTVRTSATGGKALVLANAEYRFPLFGQSGRLFGVVFVDVGHVSDTVTKVFRLRDFRVTPGLGIRFASPIGPVRLDVGYNPHDPRSGPVYVEEGENLRLLGEGVTPMPDFWGRLRLHFSVGQAF